MNHWCVYDTLYLHFLRNMIISQIPNEVTDYYLQRVGFECEDVRLCVPSVATCRPISPLSHRKRLLSLAAQKFVSDIAADAYQHARIRTNAAAGRTRTQGYGGARVRCQFSSNSPFTDSLATHRTEHEPPSQSKTSALHSGNTGSTPANPTFSCSPSLNNVYRYNTLYNSDSDEQYTAYKGKQSPSVRLVIEPVLLGRQTLVPPPS